MRSDPIQFALANEAASREPRIVVRIEFPLASPYITSHDDIPSVPGDVLEGMLQRPSSISQRIIPDQGRSEIGSFTFTIVDKDQAFTEAMRTQYITESAGLRRRRVQLYIHNVTNGVVPDFTTFQLFQTQTITGASYKDGKYTIRCSDITREQRKEVFRPVTTTLISTCTETDTTLTVNDAADFEMVAHGPSYSDAPNLTVGYFQLEEEIIRYTGTTAGSPGTFTGCTRGVLNTVARAHVVDATTSVERRQKIEEYIYLEAPGPKLALAVNTGELYGTANVLPDHWHLGIDPDLIRESDFTAIGLDLWDPTNDGAAAPLIFRFEGLKAQDGKTFLEKQIYLPLGCFSPVYSDGSIGLKRRTGVISEAAPVVTLTQANIVSMGELEHDYRSLHNDFRIFWARDPIQEQFARVTEWLDLESEGIHGKGDLYTLEFTGIHSQRATDATIALKMDSIRDAYAEPPQRVSISVLGSLSRLEVGDIARINVSPHFLRDFVGAAGDYNRSFEIEQKTYDPVSGEVRLELFGSTARPNTEPFDESSTPLPDAFYSSAGTALNTVITITAGTMAAGSHTLTGNASLTASGAIYYYLGDLTIPDGCTITIHENVQLRIMGFLTLNGDIVGTGNGRAGVVDPGTGAWDATFAGNPGFVGNSRGWDGIKFRGGARPQVQIVSSIPARLTAGLNHTFPVLTLKVDGATLNGLPPDLRGTGGAPGGRIIAPNDSLTAIGGPGADGGAGLALICRGMSMGASGSITLDGANASQPSITTDFTGFFDVYPGTGGAGGPGAFLLLLDGNALSVPVISGKFFARTGSVPHLGNPLPSREMAIGIASSSNWPGNPYVGFADPAVITQLDHSLAARFIQYIPGDETPEDDPDFAPSPISDVSVVSTSGGNLIEWALPANEDYTVIQIWASIDNDRANALLAGETKGSQLVHKLPMGGIRYYWGRTKLNVFGRAPVYSIFSPLDPLDGVISNTEIPTQTPDTASRFRAYPELNGIRFTWSVPVIGRLTGKIELWESATATPFVSATKVWEGFGFGTFLPKTDTTTRYYWIRFARGGVFSTPEPAGDGLASAASSVTSVLSLYITPSNVHGSANPLNPTDPQTISTSEFAVATATGGTPAYGYLWTLEGDATGITITNPTSASTKFTGTNTLDGTVRNFIARCTVTDGVAATATYTIPAQLYWPDRSILA